MPLIAYFAYGSNMLTERLQARCASARPRGIASVRGHRLTFAKKGRDGSGKATLAPCPDPNVPVFGVVFDLDENDLPRLDRIEGVGNGYDRLDGFRVQGGDPQDSLAVVTYRAGTGFTDIGLMPFDWYLDLVIAGARQHGLAPEYIAALAATTTASDPDPQRASRLEALRLLGRQPVRMPLR